MCSPGATPAGRFGQTTPPLVEFLKDILRRYPEGGQILKVSDGGAERRCVRFIGGALIPPLCLCETPPKIEKLCRLFDFILKELIQNAEDAGASEVKFMYDETEFGVESLWSPDMAQHQGEAVKRLQEFFEGAGPA